MAGLTEVELERRRGLVINPSQITSLVRATYGPGIVGSTAVSRFIVRVTLTTAAARNGHELAPVAIVLRTAGYRVDEAPPGNYHRGAYVASLIVRKETT